MQRDIRADRNLSPATAPRTKTGLDGKAYTVHPPLARPGTTTSSDVVVERRSTRTGGILPFGKWAAKCAGATSDSGSEVAPAAELRQAQVIVSAPTRAAHTLGKVLPWEVLRLRAYTGGTRTDSTSTRPTVNNAVPVQHGCGRSLRPALLGPHPGNLPRPPLRLPLVTRRVAPCRFRQAASAAPRAHGPRALRRPGSGRFWWIVL